MAMGDLEVQACFGFEDFELEGFVEGIEFLVSIIFFLEI